MAWISIFLSLESRRGPFLILVLFRRTTAADNGDRKMRNSICPGRMTRNIGVSARDGLGCGVTDDNFLPATSSADCLRWKMLRKSLDDYVRRRAKPRWIDSKRDGINAECSLPTIFTMNIAKNKTARPGAFFIQSGY